MRCSHEVHPDQLPFRSNPCKDHTHIKSQINDVTSTETVARRGKAGDTLSLKALDDLVERRASDGLVVLSEPGW
jgi:hypothetical protein